MGKAFRKGGLYSFIDWFTGGHSIFEVASIGNGKIKFNIKGHEPDGFHERSEEFDLEVTVNGDQYVTVYEYHGEEARIYA